MITKYEVKKINTYTLIDMFQARVSEHGYLGRTLTLRNGPSDCERYMELTDEILALRREILNRIYNYNKELEAKR